MGCAWRGRGVRRPLPRAGCTGDPVREPLVLVSQIQRSGGTLLSQLFDGHPECHAHPHELTIGYPRSQHWPRLDLDDPSSWYEMLYEKYPQKHFRRGYQKPAERPGSDDFDVFQFLFLPRLQKAIFDAAVAGPRSSATETSSIATSPRTSMPGWTTTTCTPGRRGRHGIRPRLNAKSASVDGFFTAYPDGFLVSIVRDPRAWYSSLRKQSPTVTTTSTRPSSAGGCRPTRRSTPGNAMEIV
jgi:hypothetical protein